jgi:hypothetical protein
MAAIGRDDRLLVQHNGQYAEMTLMEYMRYIRKNTNVYVYVMSIDGTLCPRTFEPVTSLVDSFGGRRDAFRLYTDNDLDGHDVHVNYVANAYKWDSPEDRMNVFRVRMENGTPKVYMDQLSDMDTTPYNPAYVQSKGILLVLNAPVGWVVNGYPITSQLNTFLPVYV